MMHSPPGFLALQKLEPLPPYLNKRREIKERKEEKGAQALRLGHSPDRECLAARWNIFALCPSVLEAPGRLAAAPLRKDSALGGESVGGGKENRLSGATALLF